MAIKQIILCIFAEINPCLMAIQLYSTESTICAISTANGVGGIAVIRISGKDTFAVVDTIFKPHKREKSLLTLSAYSACYGQIINPATTEIIDEVVVLAFHNPHSFTGEDVAEISCHGSLYIQQEILKLLLENGCTLAQPGEYTQRAFLNGKIDLSQAEAVADLIASTSAATNRLALQQMRGGFSKELAQLRDKLLVFSSLVELELDFSEEDVEFADRTQLKELADTIAQKVKKLANSFALGNAIKNGIPVSIVGETNAGKSTLLNLLVGEEKALVSDIHGTTRDAIEDVVNLNGVQFRFVDTAGIRSTNDVVENLGIKRTYEKIEQAQIVLWVIDSTQPINQIEAMRENIAPYTEEKELILVFNKMDSIDKQKQIQLVKCMIDLHVQRTFISAKNNENCQELETLLLRSVQLPEADTHDIVVTNTRHFEALTHVLQSIEMIQQGLQTGLSGDFLAQDVRECIHHLGLITGHISSDEILHSIFSRFCIGK